MPLRDPRDRPHRVRLRADRPRPRAPRRAQDAAGADRGADLQDQAAHRTRAARHVAGAERAARAAGRDDRRGAAQLVSVADLGDRAHHDPRRARREPRRDRRSGRASSASRSASARRRSCATSSPASFMLIEDQYGVGDVIDTGVATGTVEGVSLRTTRPARRRGHGLAHPERRDPARRQQEPAVDARDHRRRGRVRRRPRPRDVRDPQRGRERGRRTPTSRR